MFWQLNCILMLNWIVEIELFICVKMDLVLNNLQGWYAIKPKQTNKRPTRTFRQQLCTDTGCSLEDLPEAMDNKDK